MIDFSIFTSSLKLLQFSIKVIVFWMETTKKKRLQRVFHK